MSIQKSTLGVLLGIMILLTGCATGKNYLKNAEEICSFSSGAEKENCIKAISNKIASRINFCNTMDVIVKTTKMAGSCEKRVIKKLERREVIKEAMGAEGVRMLQRVDEENRQRYEAERNKLAKEQRMAQQKQKKQKAKQEAKRKALEKILRKQHASEKKPTDSETKQYVQQFIRRVYEVASPYPLKNIIIRKPVSDGVAWNICFEAFGINQKGIPSKTQHILEIRNGKIVNMGSPHAEVMGGFMMGALARLVPSGTACGQERVN